MAGNPKYGLTYKTSDGKIKTLTGINLGTGSYTSEQITDFVGIVAAVTNKIVTALDITAANAIPPPEPPKELIETFTISPSTLSVAVDGEPVTAEIAITTNPQDAPYQLSIPDAPDWVSIDDTTIIFAPPVGTTPDHYLFTVTATTKDDQAEFAVTLDVTPKVKKDPNLRISASSNITVDSKKNGTVDMYAAMKSFEGQNEFFIMIGFNYDGAKGSRKITVSGGIVNATNRSIKNVTLTTADKRVTINAPVSGAITRKSGDSERRVIIKLSEDDNYLASSKTVTFINGASEYTIPTKTY